MKKKNFLICVLVISFIVLTGCQSKQKTVSVTVYPLEYLFEKIGSSHIKVNNISQENVLIQSAKVNGNIKNMIENSDALFYIHEMEPYFDLYSELMRESKINLIDLGSKATFYKFQRYTLTDSNQQTIALEEPYYQGSTFENIDMYKYDPMFWLDPIAMIGVAEIVRDYLIESYPEHKSDFIKNFKSLELDLTQLDVEYQKLKNIDSPIAFASISPSFGNWQKAYGIRVYPITLSKFGAIPSEEQLEIVKQKIIEDGVKYIVYEPNLTQPLRELYHSIKEELGLEEIKMANLSSLSKEEQKENKDYLTIMYDNLAALEEMEDIFYSE